MQILMIPPTERSGKGEILDKVFKLRHEIFNGFLNWSLPHVNGREKDEFDHAATHVVALSEFEEVIGTWRLMPTTGRYMTNEIFPQFFDEKPAPCDPQVWDLSRCAVSRDLLECDQKEMHKVLAAMGCAIMEFGILNGISTFLSVENSHVAALSQLLWGGPPEWQSKTIDAGATDATCYAWAPNLEVLYVVREKYSIPVPALAQYRLPLAA